MDVHTVIKSNQNVWITGPKKRSTNERLVNLRGNWLNCKTRTGQSSNLAAKMMLRMGNLQKNANPAKRLSVRSRIVPERDSYLAVCVAPILEVIRVKRKAVLIK